MPSVHAEVCKVGRGIVRDMYVHTYITSILVLQKPGGKIGSYEAQRQHLSSQMVPNIHPFSVITDDLSQQTLPSTGTNPCIH